MLHGPFFVSILDLSTINKNGQIFWKDVNKLFKNHSVRFSHKCKDSSQGKNLPAMICKLYFSRKCPKDTYLILRYLFQGCRNASEYSLCVLIDIGPFFPEMGPVDGFRLTGFHNIFGMLPENGQAGDATAPRSGRGGQRTGCSAI